MARGSGMTTPGPFSFFHRVLSCRPRKGDSRHPTLRRWLAWIGEKEEGEVSVAKVTSRNLQARLLILVFLAFISAMGFFWYANHGSSETSRWKPKSRSW